MITRQLIERVFSAANIQRWNDHVRPAELTELDKQAHKMIFAYVLAKFGEEEAPGKVDWVRLIEGGIFEFFHRVMLTDIKPAIFHEMMSKKGDELNRWVSEKLKDELEAVGGNFRERFERYFFDRSYAAPEKRVLKASHYLATRWEFKMLYPMNAVMYGIERTKEEIESQIEDYYDLVGVRNIVLCPPYEGFLDLCGQLRFQSRWAQSPRIPRTSVLGHMLVVALFTYLCGLEIGLAGKRVFNDFFSSLFHDLPEVLTRDIISPIKTSVEGLEDIIKLYEKKQIEEKILPLLPESWHAEMRYFVENEFRNRVVEGGKVVILEGEIGERHRGDAFSPVDGKLVQVCDKFAAYVEASLSIGYGVSSDNLTGAREKLLKQYRSTVIEGFAFAPLFDAFK